MKQQQQKRSAQQYWRSNLRLVAICLVIWFIASYGLGILFVEQLNRIQFFGFKLGFWFAQQGSIYVFLVLIFWYAHRMNRLDREFGAVDRDAGVAAEDESANAGESEEEK